jgi:hypothetical protein
LVLELDGAGALDWEFRVLEAAVLADEFELAEDALALDGELPPLLPDAAGC